MAAAPVADTVMQNNDRNSEKFSVSFLITSEWRDRGQRTAQTPRVNKTPRLLMIGDTSVSKGNQPRRMDEHGSIDNDGKALGKVSSLYFQESSVRL